MEPEEEEEEEAAPPKKKENVVSGGLIGFGVAKDLLELDFSDPEVAPPEYRAVAYNQAPPVRLRSGLSGAPSCCGLEPPYPALAQAGWAACLPACSEFGLDGLTCGYAG